MANTKQAASAVAVSAAAAAWVRPSVLMAADPSLRKLEVGQKISPKALGWAPHPTFGMIPDFEVTQVLSDGRLGNGKFICTAPECTNEVAVAPGDLFQKRRCPDHQEQFGGTGRNKRLSPEEKERRAQERAKQRDLDKIVKNQKELLQELRKNKASDAELKAADARRIQLIQDTAKKLGVPVSNKALEPLV